MVQHSRADDVVEAATERGDLLDGQLVQFEIGQVVAVDQAPGCMETGRADVDAGDVRAGIAGRVASGLGGTAAGDEDLVIVAILAGRPHPSVLDSPVDAVAPCRDLGIEVADRGRVGMALVELGDLVDGVRFSPSGVGGAHELVMPACSFSRTLSMLKLAGSWRGGNSTSVWRCSATNA